MVSILDGAVAAYNAAWFATNAYNLSALLRRKGQDGDNPTKEQLERFKAENTGRMPMISILLPAYREERVLCECIAAIERMDYPKESFEVLVMLEKEDTPTRALADSSAKLHNNIRPIVVSPRNDATKGKPHALNEGLKVAKGSIVGVVDAEDIVERDLLLTAAYMITEKGHDAVQGVLDMANDRDGWKNLMQRAEYGYWFRRYLGALARAKYPVPFGGTTNFFRKSLLEELGGWDARNLTEDFELGMRIFNRSAKAKGSKGNDDALRPRRDAAVSVATISSTTIEESPTTLGAWLRQRTRWEQGKIQTLKKNLKDPPQGATHKIHTFFATMQPHMAAVNITGIGVSIYAFVEKGISIPVEAIASFNMAMIGFYAAMNAVGYLTATKEEKETVRFRGAKAAISAITLPAYWAMQWAADLRAMKLEYTGSRAWEKTDHFGRHFQNDQTQQERRPAK